MSTYLKFLFFVLFCEFSQAEYGFLQVKQSLNSEPVQFCAAYNGAVKPFPIGEQLILWNSWHQVIHAYPSYGCNLTNDDYDRKYVFVRRGNCTFAEKAMNVQQANGQGVIVVSNSGLAVPGVDANDAKSINISLLVITEESYKGFLNLPSSDGIEEPRVLVYTPTETGVFFDPSLIVMWFLAFLVLAYGAWCQGATQKKLMASDQTDLKLDKLTQTPAPSCHANVKKSENASNSNRKSRDSSLDLTVTPVMALIFFLMSSISLLLLYYFYDYLVYVIIALFCYVSSLSLFSLALDLFERSACFTRHRIPPNKIPLLRSRPSYLSILLYLACGAFATVWAVYRKENFSWILQDILGASFCVVMIKTIRLPSFKISTIMLMLFFVYDIFYVFITPFLTKGNKSIMVEVATGASSETKEELPMLFKIPKLIVYPLLKCFSRDYSLLGYGDVILPGLHVGYCAVWDVIKSQQKTVKCYSYYIAALTGYGLGLIFTYIAVILMQTGQPALLYLSPCLILSTLIVAVKKKEVGSIWRGKYKPLSTSSAVGTSDESHSLLEVNPQP